MKRRRIQGFSILELMIALVVIGVLTALVVPRVQTYQLKARRAEALTKIADLEGVEHTFYVQYGVWGLCLGSMGIEWPGGWYGINTKAPYSDASNAHAVARGKGALCADGVSGALTQNIFAFPITKWKAGCSAYSANPYGNLSIDAAGDLLVVLGSYHRSNCQYSADYESDRLNAWEQFWVRANSQTGFSVTGPVTCESVATCVAPVPIE
jgi:prepilin-type N-terminal cleavage/methylation domain-containing protein